MQCPLPQRFRTTLLALLSQLSRLVSGFNLFRIIVLVLHFLPCCLTSNLVNPNHFLMIFTLAF